MSVLMDRQGLESGQELTTFLITFWTTLWALRHQRCQKVVRKVDHFLTLTGQKVTLSFPDINVLFRRLDPA